MCITIGIYHFYAFGASPVVWHIRGRLSRFVFVSTTSLLDVQVQITIKVCVTRVESKLPFEASSRSIFAMKPGFSVGSKHIYISKTFFSRVTSNLPNVVLIQ